MKQKLLLLDDVTDLGRSGEIVEVRPGYARNYLLPQKFAIVANRNTLRKQQRLQEERAKKAEIDRKESDALAQKIKDKLFTIEVKVDPEGHLYGSVASADIADLLQKEGFPVEKKSVPLPKAIKKLGEYPLILKLKEGVTANIKLKIISEGGVLEAQWAKEAAAAEAAKKAEAPPEIPEEPEQEINR